MRGTVLLIAAGLMAGCQSPDSDSLAGTYKAEWMSLEGLPMDPMRPVRPFDIWLEFLPNNRVMLRTQRDKSKPATQTPGSYKEENKAIKVVFDQGHAASISLYRDQDGSLMVGMWGEDNYVSKFVRDR